MFAVTELTLPPLPPPLREELGFTVEPLLRRVDLAMLQALLDTNRLAPGAFLTPAELTIFSGFTFPKRRREWLGGRLAAKAAAMAWDGQPVTTTGLAGWRVSSAPDGRPGLARVKALPGAARLELSISHSHGQAAALVMAARPCGLDLQKITDTVIRVRERFCSEAESDLLRHPGTGLGDRDELRLTLLWAAKEALRKGRGGVPLLAFLATRLTGVERLGQHAWCFRLELAEAREYPVIVFLENDFAGAISVV